MRIHASVLHIDLDAFFAAVEQRDKPSLQGRPVVVGGTGRRGVVATASYEARRFGVRSAMSTAEARARCPHAAFLSGRFRAYQDASAKVMETLRKLSPLVEPLSLDEAYVDLTAADPPLSWDEEALTRTARRLKADVAEATGGLTASVGIASSKLLAKIASELKKPAGLVVVPPGTERALLRPMPVTVIPGVGPATAQRLRRSGVDTVADLERLDADELVRLMGRAHGTALYALARADDDRPVVADRETKSVSVEDTFDTDLVDPVLLSTILDRHVRLVCDRLANGRLSGRTVTVKVRRHDFTTHTRSATFVGPTDRRAVVGRVARRLLTELDTSGGIRLLGVGVSGLADWVQDDLFDEAPDDTRPVQVDGTPAPESVAETVLPSLSPDHERPRQGHGWVPGMDVEHADLGPGWVWGAGLGRVTVRFETAETGPGPVHTFADTDPALRPSDR